MNFIDLEHKDFYNKKIGQAKVRDRYEQVLIYLLASTAETRQHFDEIYNLQKNEINIESIKAPWQTSTSINICRFAFNLYGDIMSDEPEEGVSYLYTVSEIIKKINVECAIEALQIRFFT